MKKYIAILVLTVTLAATLFGANALAYAEIANDNATENFDETFVLNDLKGATVWGKEFDENDYPKDVKGELRLLEFVEFCFSTKFSLQDNYGLYLYVYNPQCIEFADNVLNKVQVATYYDNGDKATKYEKFNIWICSSTADRLFYKFKIEGVEKIFDRVATSPDERRYDISGIELLTPKQTNAHDYKVGGTWIYKGYAKGCHASSEEESTLTTEIKSLTTIELDDLQFTVYRTWQSDEWADQLTSVYFSVPSDIARDYDRLYSIQAETYQYLTSPIFCVYDRCIVGTSSLLVDYEALYRDLYKQRGIANPIKQDRNLSRVFYWEEGEREGADKTYRSGYNAWGSGIKQTLETMAWIFQVSEKEHYSVTSETLLLYMKNYSAEFGREVNGKYSKDLFADFYYDYSTKYPTFESGYLPLNIDISGKYDFTLVGSDTKMDFWGALFGKWDGKVASQPISPIVEITYSELLGLSEEQIANKYYINKSDVSKFKEYVRTQTNRVVYLFRFAKSEYYTTDVDNNYGCVGYLAQEVAYLDFDIISMGYEKDGVVTIIPVVASPIDIIGGVESGKDIGNNKGLNLIALLLGIVLVIAIIWLAYKLFEVLTAKK